MRRYYQILGVPFNATPDEIRAAWIFSIKAFHPDKFAKSSPEQKATAGQRTQAINEAYEVLSNPVTRAQYDRDRVKEAKTKAAPEAPPPEPPPHSSAPPVTPSPIPSVPPPSRGHAKISVIAAGIAIVFTYAAILVLKEAPSSSRQRPKPTKQRLAAFPSPNPANTDLDSHLDHPPTQVNRVDESVEEAVSPRAAGDTFDLPSLARRTRPAVLLVRSFDASRKLLATGSGFFVSNDGLVVTNWHVVSGAFGIDVRAENGAFYRVKGIMAASEQLDLVVLKADARSVPFLAVERDSFPEVGSRIAVIGSPVTLEGTLTEGIVSAIRAADDGTWIQITAPVSPGSSSSPVLGGNGAVVGVATLNSGGRVQNLNFARSGHDLAQLITQIPEGTKPQTLSDFKLKHAATPSPSPVVQATYRVVGLPARMPFLNIRSGPSSQYAVVGVFTKQGRGIILGPGRVTNGTTVWQEVFSGSYHGWVNVEYIQPEN